MDLSEEYLLYIIGLITGFDPDKIIRYFSYDVKHVKVMDLSMENIDDALVSVAAKHVCRMVPYASKYGARNIIEQSHDAHASDVSLPEFAIMFAVNLKKYGLTQHTNENL